MKALLFYSGAFFMLRVGHPIRVAHPVLLHVAIITKTKALT